MSGPILVAETHGVNVKSSNEWSASRAYIDVLGTELDKTKSTTDTEGSEGSFSSGGRTGPWAGH